MHHDCRSGYFRYVELPLGRGSAPKFVYPLFQVPYDSLFFPQPDSEKGLYLSKIMKMTQWHAVRRCSLLAWQALNVGGLTEIFSPKLPYLNLAR